MYILGAGGRGHVTPHPPTHTYTVTSIPLIAFQVMIRMFQKEKRGKFQTPSLMFAPSSHCSTHHPQNTCELKRTDSHIELLRAVWHCTDIHNVHTVFVYAHAMNNSISGSTLLEMRISLRLLVTARMSPNYRSISRRCLQVLRL